MTKVALDTNILAYMHEEDLPDKQCIAEGLVLAGGIISTQVVSEYINVLRRKLSKPKEQILEDVAVTLSLLRVHKVDDHTLQAAVRLIRRFKFQIFDSIVVAAALESWLRHALLRRYAAQPSG